jgi:hypothetical protein
MAVTHNQTGKYDGQQQKQVLCKSSQSEHVVPHSVTHGAPAIVLVVDDA